MNRREKPKKPFYLKTDYVDKDTGECFTSEEIEKYYYRRIKKENYERYGGYKKKQRIIETRVYVEIREKKPVQRTFEF